MEQPAGHAPAVLPLLVAACALVAAGLPVLSQAPNRLLTGQGLMLHQLWTLAPAGAWAVPALALLAAAGLWRPHPAGSGWSLAALLVAGPAWLAVLLTIAARLAASSDSASAGLSRTALASGFWLTSVGVALACSQALRGLGARPWQRGLYGLAALALGAMTVHSGALDALSLLKEYGSRSEDFWRGVREHGVIVGWTVLATGLIGLPLGIAVQRRPAWRTRVFTLLNLVQTLPSIAMFGLLMAALALLVQAFPVLGRWGLRGVGITPAVIALTLYSLLPLVTKVCAGLDQVPAGVREAAAGMGLSQRQRLWQVDLPLALPVIASGFSVMGVQAIGLAAVAALIGAGGLGALMFEGLFSSAVDLVVLAVIPIVLMAWTVEMLGAALASTESLLEPGR